jgi:hypothetical protein
LKKQIELLEIQAETLRIELRAEKERSRQERLPSNPNPSSNNGPDVSYYLEKIKALEEALAAVGEEYSDSR